MCEGLLPMKAATLALPVLCGLLGLILGSFLNVVIHRVPRQESIVSPRSVLRGRSLMVELACGALLAGAALRFGLDWTLPAFVILLAGLLALACTDFEHYLLPKRIVYPVLGMVGGLLFLAAAITGAWDRLAVAIACAAGWFAVFFAINLVDSRMLGFGDVRLAPVLGLGLGWLGVRYVVLGFLVANLIGAVIGLGLMAAKRAQRNSRVPYGVFLALGAYVAIYAGPWLPQRMPGT